MQVMTLFAAVSKLSEFGDRTSSSAAEIAAGVDARWSIRFAMMKSGGGRLNANDAWLCDRDLNEKHLFDDDSPREIRLTNLK